MIMDLSKQTKSLIIGLNMDATAISTKLRKIYSEMYVVNPNLEEMELILNNVEELLEEMNKDVQKLKQCIKQ